MSDNDLIRRGDALAAMRSPAFNYDRVSAIAAIPAVTAPQKVDAPYLSKTGDLIGHPLEQKLRNEWRKVAKHHGVPHNGVLEADLVRAFLVALAPAQPAPSEWNAAIEAAANIANGYGSEACDPDMYRAILALRKGTDHE